MKVLKPNDGLQAKGQNMSVRADRGCSSLATSGLLSV